MKFREVEERYRSVKEGLTERQETLFSVLLFLVKFSILSIPLYLLINSSWEATFLRNLNAAIAAPLLNILGVQATSTLHSIYAGDIILNVTRDSTGWKSLLAFTALVLSTNFPARKKLAGVIFGTAVIFLANIIRIVTMVYAVTRLGIEYDFLHTFLWRWGLTFVVLLAWVAWFRTGGTNLWPERELL